jgi:hypothetical protein
MPRRHPPQHSTAQFNTHNRHLSSLTKDLLIDSGSLGDFINSSTAMSESKSEFRHEVRYSPRLGSETAEAGEIYRN